MLRTVSCVAFSRLAIALMAVVVVLAGMFATAIPPLPVAQDPVKAGPNLPAPILKPWMLPANAVVIAKAQADAIQKASPTSLPFVRWLWLQDPSADNYQAYCYTVNLISRATTIVVPGLVGGVLVQVDLRDLYPIVEDLAEALVLWENFRFDPHFSLILTRDTLRLLTADDKAKTQVRQSKVVYTWDGDKTDPTGKKGKWVATGKKLVVAPVSELTDFVAERVNAKHLAGSGIEELQTMCLTEAPVVHGGYFLSRVLSSIKDKDGNNDSVYSLIYGGLYPDFLGVKPADGKVFKTDLDRFFFDFGVSSKDETFAQVFDRLRSDESAILYRSDITAKPRAIQWVATRKVRLSVGIPAMIITLDIRRKDVDIGDRAFANLLNPRVKAFEILWVLPNGLQGGLLFNGDGKLLEKGADDVASDREIPEPNTTELQGYISCLGCHNVKQSGWMPFANDAQKSPVGIFADLSELNRSIPDTLDRLKGRYSAPKLRTDLLLQRLRDDHQQAVSACTNNWDVNSVVLAGKQVTKAFSRERWDVVTPAMALQELGQLAPDPKTPPELDKDKKPIPLELTELRRLMPKENLPAINGIRLTDPRIDGGILAGINIDRSDWDLAYPFALDRVQFTLSKAADKKGEGNEKPEPKGMGNDIPNRNDLAVLGKRPHIGR